MDFAALFECRPAERSSKALLLDMAQVWMKMAEAAEDPNGSAPSTNINSANPS
jgi:hypothetical protein